MKIPEINAMGFDCDGTIVDNMLTKAEAFAESVIEFYPDMENNNESIKKIFLCTRGIPRTEQLAEVQKKYGLKSLPNIEYQKWSELYTSKFIDKKAPLFEDTIRILEELEKRGYLLFVSSGVPQKVLEKTLKPYCLEKYFKYVLGVSDDGKFKKGLPHLTYVSKNSGIPLENIAFVGDGEADVKGANEAGCFSVGIIDSRFSGSEKEIMDAKPKIAIRRLSEVLDYFK